MGYWKVLRLAILAVFALVFFPQASSQAQESQSSKSASSAPSANAGAQGEAGGEYVGAETCKSCHEELYNKWEKSPHWKTTLKAKSEETHAGCEGCHGPGGAHVAGGGDVTKIFTFKDATVKQINERCLTCHAGGNEHMNAINSLHSENGVSCISCHSPHHAETKEYLLTKAQPELCYTCHLAKKAEFAMPFHHRVDEGLIQCSDCHNVHGTVKPSQVRSTATQDAVCFKCHTDKQGPFVYEHPAVKIDGCQSCHEVHGGPNPHMLKLSNVNLLCLQCHTTSSFSGAPGAPSFHNQATFFQACTLCHIAIHGSNFSSTYFK